MVSSMKPGSVIVDLAVERGGNVEGAKLGETVVTPNGVKIVGHANVPGRLAATSSSLYAKNLFAFLEIMIDKASKALVVPWDDELVKATLLTRDGAVVHPNFQSAAAAPAPAAEPAGDAPADAPAGKAKAAPKKSTKA
jgi:H+-translocating NAD(P) transhydrogenase subunit alpha